LPPLTVEQTVSEGLAALCANRPSHLSGALYRVMNRVMPRSLFREMNGNMILKVLTKKQKQTDPVVLMSGSHQE
jgi:hypothetical protein